MTFIPLHLSDETLIRVSHLLDQRNDVKNKYTELYKF